MAELLTVVMYHYVRDFQNTRFPRIKGLDVRSFEHQIDYLQRYHNIVTVEDCLEALRDQTELPPRPVLLTFDDGYVDHYDFVLPILTAKRLQGTFFVPARPVQERVVLDVNKIHHILACTDDPAKLLESLAKKMDACRERFGLETPEAYEAQVTDSSRFDPREVIVIKRLLQRDLPPEARAVLTDELFQEVVTSDEAAFAEMLYLNEEQIGEMVSSGMRIGNHGYGHLWWTSLTGQERESEIRRGISFLDRWGQGMPQWILSYPYGDCNDEVVELVRDEGCVLAFTSVPDLAVLDARQRFTLARLDTNDFPKHAEAPPNEWTLRAGGRRADKSSG